MIRVAMRLFVVSLLLIGASSVAAQQDELDFEPSLQIVYAPFSGLPSSESLQLRVRPAGINIAPDQDNYGVPQSLIIRIRPTNQGAFVVVGEQLQLPVVLQSDGATPLQSINSEYRQLVIINPASTEAIVFDYSFMLPESLYADTGRYILELDVELLDPVTEDVIGATKSLEVEVLVETKLQTNIAGTQGRYEDGANFSVIDFGKLESGESKRVYIQVRGNASAEITVSSENNGKMRNTEKPTAYVDYSVLIDGEFSTLSSPMTLARSVAKDLQGSAYPMEVTIGDVDSSYAGTYQDIIHVDVSPQ